ncbi:(Fe-S)-binding protein [bacterium]|nr:MAG: (Fe-S)-binding protein [bacterium]
MKDLGELTTHCIRCGFCLEACPTFTTTGRETDSPRGRIYLVRSALEGKLDWTEDVKPHLDRCLGCLACTTACPSGVEYGDILEMARDRLDRERPPIPKKALLALTTNPTVLKANLKMGSLFGNRVPGFVSRLLSGEAPEADQPRAQVLIDYPPLNERSLPPVKGQVYMLEGCAMKVLYPNVHEATRRLLRRVGYEVREVDQGCCGAMHAHNGDLKGAVSRAEGLIKSFDDDLPIIVNSAGCGSTMKHYVDLVGPHASDFVRRVKDLSEFLFESGLIEELKNAPGMDLTATYHDACHLAHGQGVRDIPRLLVQAIPKLRYKELGEADTCCGSAGIYNVLQPKMARSLLERKWDNVAETGASIVATGNPGCHAWIAQAAREHGGEVEVVHTAELLERAFTPGV